jgi:hypothetical protein
MGHGQLIQGLVNNTAWQQVLLLQPMFGFLSQHLLYYFFLNTIRINFFTVTDFMLSSCLISIDAA